MFTVTPVVSAMLATTRHHHHRHHHHPLPPPPMEEAVASWYDDAGNTACGFHAYYGVANRTLPCGTRVTFEYDGHEIEAVVDDRGPYVYSRTWDLNQNIAAAFGFMAVGVGTVRYRLL